MARELTAQETQALSRIRERMADASSELADATRTRRQLEAQLREVQHQMASPDGIASSEQFVDDVSRLRREIQSAAAREQEADAIRSRLSAQESQVLAAAAGQSSASAGPGRTQRVGITSPSVGVSAATSARMRVSLESLRQAQAQFERNSTARADLEKKLANNIKKTLILVFISAVCVAALADILSIFDLGWIVSWTIPMVVWAMVRRVTAINNGGDAIVAAHRSAKRQLTVLQQRLQPVLRSPEGIRALAASKTGDMVFAGKSYAMTFVRDTIITQLIELVPVIDMLPFYIGQVVKVFVDQNIAYQKVKELLPQLQHVHQQINGLEHFEIQHMANQIATVVRAQQVISSRQRRQVQSVPSRESPATAPLALNYAT